MWGYIKPLFTLSFWFKMRPEPFLPLYHYLFLIFFGFLILASAIAGRIYRYKKEKFVLRHTAKYLKSWLFTAGFVGYLLVFFNYERAVFLGARFWFLLWFLGFGFWLALIIRKIKKLPEKAKELKKQAEFQKYLPR